MAHSSLKNDTKPFYHICAADASQNGSGFTGRAMADIAA